MVIHDRIALGTYAGIAGSIPSILWNIVSVRIGLTEFYAFQLTGSVYLFPGLTDTFWGMLLGGIIWLSLGAIGGVAMAVLMSWTGQDYWWLKGLFVSIGLIYIAIYGFLYTFGAARIIPFDLATNLSELMGNIMYGLLSAYLIVHWSGEELPAD